MEIYEIDTHFTFEFASFAASRTAITLRKNDSEPVTNSNIHKYIIHKNNLIIYNKKMYIPI
jgi:hypothetical protein